MLVTNNQSYNNYNPLFGAKLGWRATYELKDTPLMLKEISQKLKNMGEPTTIVDIMSQDSKKGRMYSLRLFNEIFGDKYSISLLKDNHNKDVVSSSAKDFIRSLARITKTTLENKEYSIFNKIKKEFSSSLPLIKSLREIIKSAEKKGKYLSPKSEQIFFNNL